LLVYFLSKDISVGLQGIN